MKRNVWQVLLVGFMAATLLSPSPSWALSRSGGSLRAIRGSLVGVKVKNVFGVASRSPFGRNLSSIFRGRSSAPAAPMNASQSRFNPASGEFDPYGNSYYRESMGDALQGGGRNTSHEHGN